MCISATALMLAGTGMSALSAAQQGQSARAFGDYQARVADRDARTAEAEATVTARKIREAGRRAQADATAAVAASGLDINSGSSQDIDARIGTDFEADALAAVYSGRNQAMVRREEGSAARSSGRAARTSALMSGAAAAAAGWARVHPRRVAAPVERRDIYTGYGG